MKKIIRIFIYIFIFTLQTTLFSMHSALRYTRQASKQPARVVSTKSFVEKPQPPASLATPTFWQQIKGNIYKRLGWQSNSQQSTTTESPKPLENKGFFETLKRYVNPKTRSVAVKKNETPAFERAPSKKSISNLKPSFKHFQSLKDIAQYLKTLESDAQRQFLHTTQLPKPLRDLLMQHMKSLHIHLPSLLDTVFTQKRHTSLLPQNLIHKIENYLQLAGINSSNVILDYNTTKESDFFHHKAYKLEGCKLQYNDDGSLIVVKPAAILFNKAYIEQLTPEALDQEIIHAVTHLAQGHMEQIQEIQNTLGKTKFNMLTNTSEMRIYKIALERNAELLLATRNQQIAAQMLFKFVNDTLDSIPTNASIINATTNFPSNINVPNVSSLIECQLSEFNESLLTHITDFSILEKVLQQRYLIAKNNFIKKNIPSLEEQKTFLSFEKSIANFMHTKALVKDIPEIHRDKAIGTELQELITREIKNMNMNPLAIEFRVSSEQDNVTTSTESASIPQFGFSKLDFKNSEDEEIKKMEQGLPFEAGIPYSLPIIIMNPAKITLSPKFIKQFYTKAIPRSFAEWTIRHELTHIKLLHLLTPNLMLMFKAFKQSSDSHWIVTIDFNNPNTMNDRTNKIMNQSEFNNYTKAIEIQADLVPLMRDQAFTQSIKEFLNEGSLSRPEKYLSHSQLYLFHKAIQECWKKEKKSIRTISPNIYVDE